MKLLIFTQKVDREDFVLGFFHSWIAEFSKHFESVEVICYGKGVFDLPPNVKVYSLGKEKKLGSVMYAINSIKYLYQLRGKYDKVFVHMNPMYIVIFGWYWKLKRIPAYLWYVHRSVDMKLKVATLFVDNIFTSAKESFNIETSKTVFLGHGIDVDKLPNTSHLFTGNILKIAHVGRITQIKNLEVLLDAGAQIKKRDLKVQMTFFGDCVTEKDKEYKKHLESLIEEKGLKNDVIFAGGIQYKDLPQKLLESHITVNMTPPGGMDKVVLESILLGIPAFGSNTAFKDMFAEYADLFLYEFKNSEDLANKIYNFIYTAHNQFILDSLNTKVRKDFSLETLINRMVAIMK